MGTFALQQSKACDSLAKSARLTDRLGKLVASAPEGWCRRQSAFALLRMCIVPRLDYLAGSLSPDVMRPFALAFDNLVLDSLARILDFPPTPRHGEPLALNSAPPLSELSGPSLLNALFITPKSTEMKLITDLQTNFQAAP